MEDKIIKLYQQGIGSTTISKQLNITVGKVFWTLRKYQITTRTIKEAHRPKYLNENYFSSIDTRAKAYWLGLIAADGSIISSKQSSNRIKIDLATKDEDILYLMANDLGYDTKHLKQYFYNDTKITRLSIPSDKLCSDLAKFSIIPRKTFTLKWPSLHSTLEWHFLRGYFDGDGCITTGPRIKICGTYNIVSSIQRLFIKQCGCNKTKFSIRHPERKNKTYTLSQGGRNKVKNIYAKLYQDSGPYRLQRKIDRFNELLF